MIDYLNIYDLPPIEIINDQFKGFFTMKTCQRTLLIGPQKLDFDFGPGARHVNCNEAYGYLLEIITGLKSQFLAENEIVCQFRDAFNNYLKCENKDNRIVQILEKLFQDNKKIRTEYLKDVGKLSYTGISKKILLKNSCSNQVLILGSGNLATGLLKLLSKKFEITVSARNFQKVNELNKIFNFKVIPWPRLFEYLNSPNILSTIGAYKTYFDEDFFTNWKELHKKNCVFIDLGSPSTIKTSLTIHDGVYRLYNIFNECKALGLKKELKIINTKNAIKELVDNRVKYFEDS